MALHSMTCAHCGRDFVAAHPAAVTCSDRCRIRRHRIILRARRAQLAAEADAAARAGDLAALTRVARATASLLAA